MTFLPRLPFGRGIVLSRSLDEDGASRGDAHEVLVGRAGTALTPLRPAGTALIDGARVDVVADGEFVPKGARVEVVQREGHRVVVRAAPGVALDPSSTRRSESWSV
jgi:membrane-bound serine protease (ClpP class)